MTACSSYRNRETFCRDGFIQIPNCHSPSVCGCGASYKGNAPPCMKDEFTKAHFTEDGQPAYYNLVCQDEGRAKIKEMTGE